MKEQNIIILTKLTAVTLIKCVFIFLYSGIIKQYDYVWSDICLNCFLFEIYLKIVIHTLSNYRFTLVTHYLETATVK